MVVRGALTNWVGLTIAFITRLMPLRRIFLCSSDLSFKLLRVSTSYFGYNPRQCFKASSSVAISQHETKSVATLIGSSAHCAGDNMLQLVFKTQTDDSDISHRISYWNHTGLAKLM